MLGVIIASAPADVQCGEGFAIRLLSGSAEEFLSLGCGFDFMNVLHVGGHGAQGSDEGRPVVAKSSTGNDVGYEVCGEDEVAKGADDDAACPSGGVRVFQAVVEREDGLDGVPA